MNYLGLVWNNFKRKKLRSWLTVIGILIGITAVVSLIALGQGLQVAISSQFSFLSPDIVTVSAAEDPFTKVTSPLEKSYLNDIDKINGVKMSAGRVMGAVNVETKSMSTVTMGVSLPESGDRQKLMVDALKIKVLDGKLPEADDEVLVGNNLATDTNTKDDFKVGNYVTINDRKFRICGITKKTGSFMLDISMYLTEKSMQDMFGMKDQYQFIGVRVEQGADIKQVISDIEKELRKQRHVKVGEEDFTVQSALSTLEQINGILNGVQIFVYIIASISILVSGIGIANTMFTSVLERTKEIGIMKAIGARNSSIFILFIIESGFLGLVGGIFGTLFGSGLALGLAEIGKGMMGQGLLQAHVTPMLIFGALAFSFLVGTISGLIPAIKAAKQNPVDALNYAK